MGQEIDFDVNLISKISFRPSYHVDYYVWKTNLTKPKYKRILGIFKVKDGVEYLPVGFYEERSSYYGDNFWRFISEDYFIQCGYLIKDNNIGGGTQFKEVWRKSHVEVSLGYKSAIGKIFDTDEEAKMWIEHLKMISGKTFETIELK